MMIGDVTKFIQVTIIYREGKKMKALLTEADKKHFSESHYKFNMAQMMIGLIILTIVIQPLFLDRDNPNGALMVAAFLVTMIAFSGIGFLLMVTVRKSLIRGHLEEKIKVEDVKSLKAEMDYYVPAEYINDNYQAISGLFFFNLSSYYFFSADQEIELAEDFPALDQIEYKEIHIKGLSNILKNIPKRLYIPTDNQVHVFVIPEGHKVLEALGDKRNNES